MVSIASATVMHALRAWYLALRVRHQTTACLILLLVLQASELSRFIDEELLKDGKEGELAKLLARQNTQRVHIGCSLTQYNCMGCSPHVTHDSAALQPFRR